MAEIRDVLGEAVAAPLSMTLSIYDDNDPSRLYQVLMAFKAIYPETETLWFNFKPRRLM